jgi:hypothetical protein
VNQSKVGHRRLLAQVLGVIVWTALALVAIDVACGVVARPPRNPNSSGNAIQLYFGYGTSIESKLRRQLGPAPGKEASILKSGWLPETCDTRPAAADPKGVSVYGMSFSGRVARQLELLDPTLHITTFGGPGAPLNHSYACFLRRYEAGIDRNQTQVLGILGGSVRRLATMSGTSTSFEQPQPFTYPRFFLRDGKLARVDPPINDVSGLRRLLANHQRWVAYIDGLTRTDHFASPFLANHSFVDQSVVLRLLRRAWGQHYLNDLTSEIKGKTGRFEGDPELVPTMRAILMDFAQRTRARGQQPIVLLFEDRGYDRALRDTVVPMLQANGIPYVLSADIAPATDAGVFEADGHFLPSIDREIARATLPLVDPAAH